MFEFVELTSGDISTAVELTDMVNHALVGYGPTVASFRENPLSGEGPYDNVIDTITFHTIGNTAAEAYAAADRANHLLDQARRWWKNKNVSPVKLRAKAQGSSLAPLEVLIKGRAPDGPPNIALQVGWNQSLCKYISKDISIQFVRRGPFLGAQQTSTTGASTAITDSQVVTFSASHPTESPLVLTLAGFNSNDAVIADGVILVDPTNNLTIRNAENFASAYDWTGGVAEGNNARNGQVLRYTPTTTNRRYTESLTVPANLVGVRTLGFVATVRNNNANMEYLMGIETAPLGPLSTASGFAYGSAKTTPIKLDASQTTPRVLVFGTATSRLGHEQWSIWAQALSTPGGQTLNVDSVMMFDADSVQLIGFTSTIPLSVFGAGVPLSLVVEDRSLSDRTAAVALRNASGDYLYLDYSGDPHVALSGNTVAVALLATRGIYWRYSNAANAVVNTTLTATRRPAYLIPT